MHISSLSLLASVISTLVSAEYHGLTSKRNHGVSVFRRGGDAQFTYYQDGLGACGKTNKPSDFVVALNSQDFAGGSHCFETITITIGDKSVQAMIVDECMGCGPNNIDCSEDLFKFLGSESAGVLHGSWDYGGGDPSPSPSPSPKHEAKPSPSPSPSPKSTSKPSSKAQAKLSSTTKPSTPSATQGSIALNPEVQTVGTLNFQEANSSNIYAINMAFMGLSGLVASP